METWKKESFLSFFFGKELKSFVLLVFLLILFFLECSDRTLRTRSSQTVRDAGLLVVAFDSAWRELSDGIKNFAKILAVRSSWVFHEIYEDRERTNIIGSFWESCAIGTNPGQKDEFVNVRGRGSNFEAAPDNPRHTITLFISEK